MEKLNDYIKKYFYYDYLSNKITRTDRKNSNGSLDKDGYLIKKHIDIENYKMLLIKKRNYYVK